MTDAPPRARASTRTFWITLIFLVLVLPVSLGALVGWYGINPPAAERVAPVGSEAHHLLNSFPDASLVVEIDYQTGWAPPASAVSLLLSRINETCQKSSVTVEEFPFSTSDTTFTDGSLRSTQSAARHTWPVWGVMSLEYLIVGGSYGPDAQVIGLAYGGSSIAVFGGTIQSSAPGAQLAAVYATVMIHEFGHELGLVGEVGAAPNQDPNHPYHSNDPADVMYWQVDSTSLFGLLGGGPPNQFGAADIADLNTVRGSPILIELLPWISLAALWGVALVLVVYERRGRRRRG